MISARNNLSQTTSLDRGDSALGAALEEFQRRTEQGGTPDIQDFAREFPAIESELIACLENLQQIQQLAQALSNVSGTVLGLDLVRQAGVLGDYCILREVGRGGMGVVYEAEQISLSRRVALKILPFAAVLDPRHLQRFKNEAMAAAHLDHPNIVEVYGIGCERSIHFYAMRYVEGVTLADVIEAKRRSEREVETRKSERGSRDLEVTPALSILNSAETSPVLQAALTTIHSDLPRERYVRIAELAVQTAEALDHAHQMGIVHRDIKPSNLMLDKRGKLWITDFGLARNQGDASMTMTGDLVGTLRYMSPEQALAKRITVDHRTDIYSLGVTLYELLTLRAAFSGGDREETLRQIAFEEPKPPRKLDKSIPEELETIVLKAMEKNPDDRYATAGEVAADLRRWVEHKPIVARAPGVLTGVMKWARRHPSFVMSSVAALAIALIVVCVALALIRHEQALTQQALHDKKRALDDAEANLEMSLDTVERLFVRIAGDATHHRDFAHADVMLSDAQTLFDQIRQKPLSAEVLVRLDRGYGQIAHLQAIVGRHQESLAALEHRLAIQRELVAHAPHNMQYRLTLSDRCLDAAQEMWVLNRLDGAQSLAAEALAIRKDMLAKDPTVPARQLGVADALSAVGTLEWNCGHLVRAEATMRQALASFDALPSDLRFETGTIERHARVLGNLGLIVRDRGELVEAEACFEQALSLNQRARKAQPGNHAHVDACYVGQWNCADIKIRRRDTVAAAKLAIDLTTEFPERLQAYVDAAELLLRCAELPETSVAAALHSHSLVPRPDYVADAKRILEQSSAASSMDLQWVNQLAWLLADGRPAAIRDPARARTIAEALVKDAPDIPDCWNTLALARYRGNDPRGALEAQRKAIELLDNVPSALDNFVLAAIQAKLGDGDEARRAYETAAAEVQRQPAVDDMTANWQIEAEAALADFSDEKVP